MKVMVYGAYGYSGRLILDRLLAMGIKPVLAGRDSQKVAGLAEQTGLVARCFDVKSGEKLAEQMSDIQCLLNVAGPFSATALPLMTACLSTRAHYLDITGELAVFRQAETFDERAKAAGIMVMPGIGWDVVGSDCIALHTARRVRDPKLLTIALYTSGGLSRGSIRTGSSIMAGGPLVRANGEIVSAKAIQPRQIDFGDGPKTCILVPMGDLVTAWHATKIQNIQIYIALDPDTKLDGDPESYPEGPTMEALRAARSIAIAEVRDVRGSTVRSRIEAPAGYLFTAEIAAQAIKRVIAQEFAAGFHSPASLFGSDFAMSVHQTRYVDMD